MAIVGDLFEKSKTTAKKQQTKVNKLDAAKILLDFLSEKREKKKGEWFKCAAWLESRRKGKCEEKAGKKINK